MERHEIEVFLTLAEQLHFRRTGEHLGLAHGRVSQIVAKLERRIGAPLFERTSRSVALTPIGEQLRDQLGPAYRAVQDAIADAIAAGKGIRGALRVGFSSPWCNEIVLAAAEIFRARYPECVVRIQEIQLHDPFGPLRAGELDLQLSEFPVIEPDLRTGAVIFTEQRALLVPSGHRLAQQDSVSMEDMADAPLLVVDGDIPQHWMDAIFPARTPAGLPITHVAAAVYWQEILTMVAAGRGVSTVSLRARHFFQRPGLAYVPVRDGPPIRYGLTWRRNCETARIRAFADIVVGLAPEFAEQK
ncbi:HTH-type transcriptional regulator GltC [Nocardia cerradoensis]|uniref:HTH-type transcriptional regulator GltC n=1 Tax=Nocardia cerradoensis TaxID=85688 RepID=A0A231GTD3_9NOCA|nr:LysR family transcriptional regulator [Nocardia cerradoensis]OXR39741.1 HTH-type transcriptional regulator GltC [Nocardia cerradoensis]